MAIPFTTAYIINLKTFERLPFTYMPPEFTESKNADYAQIPIIGRSEPMLGYWYSGARIFTITLFFLITENPEAEFIQPLRMIRSLVYPDYKGPQPSIPPPVLFVVGKWLSQRCVVLNYNIKYMAPWDVNIPATHIGPLTQNQTPQTQQSLLGSIFSPQQLPQPTYTTYSEELGETDPLMTPYRTEVALTLQEVNENSDTTPYDTNEVRGGLDRGSGFVQQS